MAVFFTILVVVFSGTRSTVAKSFTRLLLLASYSAVGMTAILVPLATYLVSTAGLDNVIHQLVLFPLREYGPYRGLPYPFPPSLVVVFEGKMSPLYWAMACLFRSWSFTPILTCIVGITFVVKSWRRHVLEGLPLRDSVFFSVLFLSCGYLIYTSVRSDYMHFVPSLIFSTVLAMIIAHRVLWGVDIKDESTEQIDWPSEKNL